MKHYTQTEEWKRYRQDAIDRADGRCQMCNGKENLHVHHRLYVDDVPAAVVDVHDLTVLCGRCHLYFHRGQLHNKVGGDNRRAPKPKKNEYQEMMARRRAKKTDDLLKAQKSPKEREKQLAKLGLLHEYREMVVEELRRMER